jgi:heterodisulfide reductase subunit A-like polyferredoxin
MAKSCILFCHCSAGIVSEEKLEKIGQLVSSLEADVFGLSDLCAISIDRKDFLDQVEKNYAQKIVIACYPRAVEKLLLQTGVPFSGLETLNLRELSAEQVQDKLQNGFSFSEGKPEFHEIRSSLDVPAWFPVIDQEKCTLCGQCARFCLFGVYRFQDKKLEVVNPLNCKNLCPACGRTCPVSAIIFPRMREDSVLSGADPGQIKIDRGVLQGDSMFSKLQQRAQSRRSILRSGVLQQAEEERRRALEQIKKDK